MRSTASLPCSLERSRPRPPRRERILFFLAVTLTLLGCGGVGGPGRPAPPAAPSRIISLTPALTEILFALDLGNRVVGVTEFCDRPEAARSRPKVGGYANPSIEAILGLRPDLVVVSPGPGNRDAALAIERAGVAVAVFPAETLDESLRAIESVGERCGAAERGRALAGEIRARLDAVSRRVAGAPRVRTLFCVQTEPMLVAGRGTLPSQLVEIAGGVNVIDVERYPRIGAESLLAAAPEAVFQSRMDTAAPAEGAPELRFWRRFPTLPAVRDGRVWLLEDDAALRPGPRVADAAESLAERLHPAAGAGGSRP